MRLSVTYLAMTAGLGLACACDDRSEHPSGASRAVSPPASGTDGSGTDGPVLDSGTPSDTGPEGLDCEAFPAVQGSALRGLSASSAFAFDDQGNLVSASGTELVLQAFPGAAAEPLAPVTGYPWSLSRSPSGTLVYALGDTLTEVDPATGAQTVVATGLTYPTGIEVHPTGAVFVGDQGRLVRADPILGTTEVVLASDSNDPYRGNISGVTFSAAFDALYFGTYAGTVWRLPVDAAGYPTGAPALVWAFDVGGVLGMGVDACDNLYVLHGGLHRFVGGQGAPELLVTDPAMTNLQWGSGAGGWADTQLYVVEPQLGLFQQLDVGVPAKPTW